MKGLPLVAALAVICLASCDDPQAYPIKSGTVVGKRIGTCHAVEFVAKGQWNFACVSGPVYDSTKIGSWYEG